jgi:hypothetical protein
MTSGEKKGRSESGMGVSGPLAMQAGLYGVWWIFCGVLRLRDGSGRRPRFCPGYLIR